MKGMTKTGLLSLVVVAACALVVAAPASATVTSAGGGTKASLVNTGNTTLTVGSNVVTCTSWTITGTISGSSASAAATGTAWSGCTYTFAGISGAATVNDSTAWTLTVTASLGGGSFSISVTNGVTTIAAGPCTITIQSNTYSGLTWTNTTKSLVASVSGVKYTATGFLCPLPASGSNGAFAGSFSEPTITVS